MEAVAYVADDRERIGPDEALTVGAWEKKVWELHRDCCSNCGGTDRLRARMVVPESAGGLLVESNGVLLCRPCEMASDTISQRSSDSNRRLINFWISRSLYDKLQVARKSKVGFASMGSLIRYLMSKYVADEPRFDDLGQYQDSGSDVKVNVHVDRDIYLVFRRLVGIRGITVTDAVKSLILMYESEAEPFVSRRS